MAALRAYMSDQSDQQEAALYLPLVTYAILIASSGNLEFMAPWAVVSLAVPVLPASNQCFQTIEACE